MLDRPGVSLRLIPAECDEISGDESARHRVAEFVARYRERCPITVRPPACQVAVLTAIPAHVGFGSGTQLGMAVAKGLSVLADESGVVANELAQRVGRGRRSAIGIHGFEAGGLVVDGGKRRDAEVSPIVTRVDVPDNWRFVLVRPPSEAGCSGSNELRAFDNLPPIPETTTDRLCGIIVMDLLPALRERDFDGFALALREFNHIVGDHFSIVQRGVFSSVRMAELAAWLEHRKVVGVGQTSWGPTLFAVCESAPAAEKVVQDIASTNWSDCLIEIARPLNRGASCEVEW
jgi:beta-RFAP synthase